MEAIIQKDDEAAAQQKAKEAAEAEERKARQEAHAKDMYARRRGAVANTIARGKAEESAHRAQQAREIALQEERRKTAKARRIAEEKAEETAFIKRENRIQNAAFATFAVVGSLLAYAGYNVVQEKEEDPNTPKTVSVMITPDDYREQYNIIGRGEAQSLPAPVHGQIESILGYDNNGNAYKLTTSKDKQIEAFNIESGALVVENCENPNLDLRWMNEGCELTSVKVPLEQIASGHWKTGAVASFK